MFGKWFKKKDKPPIGQWVFVNTVYIDFVHNLYHVKCPACSKITYVVNDLPRKCPECHVKLSGLKYH